MKEIKTTGENITIVPRNIVLPLSRALADSKESGDWVMVCRSCQQHRRPSLGSVMSSHVKSMLLSPPSMFISNADLRLRVGGFLNIWGVTS